MVVLLCTCSSGVKSAPYPPMLCSQITVTAPGAGCGPGPGPGPGPSPGSYLLRVYSCSFYSCSFYSSVFTVLLSVSHSNAGGVVRAA